MAGLFDEIQERTKRQESMMAHFQKKSEQAVSFDEVNIEKTKSVKSEKEKGIIIPPINYIQDENNNA